MRNEIKETVNQEVVELLRVTNKMFRESLFRHSETMQLMLRGNGSSEDLAEGYKQAFKLVNDLHADHCLTIEDLLLKDEL